MIRVAAADVRAAVLLALIVRCVAGCGEAQDKTTLTFWAMGREGEVVQEMIRDFEKVNADIHVDVQQIPWSAAHEKVLTAFVGRTTPDVAQLGNTWIAEFVALEALAFLDDRIDGSTVVSAEDHFPGIWQTNVLDGVVYGVPWYVDTRVMFYRRDLLTRAGHDRPPTTWAQWRASMADVQDLAVDPAQYGVILPLNEWTQPAILGLQAGSPLLVENATRGVFAEAPFRRAFDFYLGLFADGLAPPITNNEIANVYQEFARGTFAFFITGPWNIGEFKRRLPAELQDAWATAPLPGPDEGEPGVSLAGGASLVVFRDTEHADAAWRLIEFLSHPEQQARFFRLTGDLPAHKAAWHEAGIVNDPHARAFWDQLQHVKSTPMLPEWEQIAVRLWERTETVIRGATSPEEALMALDADVERILEKRRWLLARQGDSEGGGDAP